MGEQKTPLGIICWVGCLLDQKTLYNLPLQHSVWEQPGTCAFCVYFFT